MPALATQRFLQAPPWRDLVTALLGPQHQLIHTGCMLSVPGSATQPWHSDGDHLCAKRHLPPHCLNVFVPLVDVTSKNGATEFVPRSHIDWGSDQPPVTPLTTAGECVLFDYRLKHRGLGNRSSEDRPMLYFTYGRASFVDQFNFSHKRYQVLPELDPEMEGDRRVRRLRRRS